MKLGITGASGVIGTLLCKKLLEYGIEISCFDGDIRSKSALAKWIKNNDWDGVIHLAAIVATNDVKNSPLLAYEVNVTGTINLLAELEKEWGSNKKWFFYASTSHVYKSSNHPIKETHELEPISLYGKTKLLAENIVNQFGSLENMPFDVCVGRIFSFYHSSQKPPFLYPTILSRLENEDLNNEFFLYGADSLRDFLNAEEVVNIIIKLAIAKTKGIYNIASGKSVKIRDFVQALTQHRLKIITDNNFDCLVADVEKIKKVLGENYAK